MDRRDLHEDRPEGRFPHLLGGLARDVADIAARHEARIKSILAREPDAATAFDEFLAELRSTLNDSIATDDAVSMVSQHLITRRSSRHSSATTRSARPTRFLGR